MSMKIGTLTRVIAIDALSHVLGRKIHADTALDRLFKNHPELRPLDKAFIYEIVYGTLRWLSKMDWIMSHMINRPYESLDHRVANALRIGAYQIYYMDKVPDRAAVSETVEAIKQVGIANAASFVNAILRRVSRKADYFPKPNKEESPIDYYSMHYSYPKWMIERWHKRFNKERFEHLCSGTNQPPKYTLKALKRNPLNLNEDLASYLLRNYGIFSNNRPLVGAYRVEKLPPFSKCEAFVKGSYLVQDESAQLVSSIVCPGEKDKVLDACSAPGMKAIYLWDSGVEPENLTVCEYSAKRLKILQENFQRVNLQGVEIWKGDVKENVQGHFFDKIVLDAPCSGLGVIKKHPEIKWLRVPADIERNAAEQKVLLDSMALHLKPGGELVYIVCSIEPEETSDQVRTFLEKHKDFEQVRLEDRVHDYYKKFLTHDDEILVIPGNSDGMDGFYAVVFKKTVSS